MCTASSRLPIGPDAPWLAPLAGFSDLPFRLICRELGAAVACTEMVSAKGLIYGLRSRQEGGATEDLLITTPEDAPLVVQLFGDDPDFLSRAVEVLRSRGYRYFDLNMGCAVPKVCKSGAGAALLRDPDRALAVAGAMIRAAEPGCAGCKIRLGWDAASPVYLDLGKALEDRGAAWLTLHPRYARQGFSGQADAAGLEALARRVAIPVIASGDLFSAEDGVARLKTGAHGVMFARGALSNPTNFRRYLALRRGEDAPEHLGPKELLRLITRHAELARLHSPAPRPRRGRAEAQTRDPALARMRVIAPRYARNQAGARRLRLALSRCHDWAEFEAILAEFF
jgi:tRNA-dihydrouridine synthase B